jgi:tRNA 2-selenouridine synthase
LITPFHFEVIAGPTGSGKTRLLQFLKRQGAQVLDLEALAQHKSSVLGFTPNQPQPSQKHFDTLIWEQFNQLDRTRVVYIESESKKVGNLSVPQELIDAMRASPCHVIEMPLPCRVSLLMEDYPHLVHDPELFQKKLQALIPLRGQEVVRNWCESIQAGRIAEVVESLLIHHYDPTYFSSMKKNFTQLPNARLHALNGQGDEDFELLSQRVLESSQSSQ